MSISTLHKGDYDDDNNNKCLLISRTVFVISVAKTNDTRMSVITTPFPPFLLHTFETAVRISTKADTVHRLHISGTYDVTLPRLKVTVITLIHILLPFAG